ncbi:MAG: hypothetical protein H7Y37_08365 [Anaerolineae bacterium]|nr:hypothetical protein [Gloeobacterales cyanobacterium ES-bin-313]
MKTSLPGNGANFSGASLLGYGGEQAVFIASYGLYAADLAGNVRFIANTTTIAPNSKGFSFSSFSDAIIEGRNVIFRGKSTAGTSGIYRSNGTSIVQILAPNGTVQVPSGSLGSVFVKKLDNNQIYFDSLDASVTGPLSGYYRSNLSSNNDGTDLANAVPLITKANYRNLPMGGGFDESEGNIVVYDLTNLVANINGQIVVLNNRSALGGGNFSIMNFFGARQDSAVSISGSRFVFSAVIALPGGGSNQGIFLYENGAFRTIADLTTSTVPFGGTGNFKRFISANVILNGDFVYFSAIDSKDQTNNYIADLNTGNVVSTFNIRPSNHSIYFPGSFRDGDALVNPDFSITTLPKVLQRIHQP